MERQYDKTLRLLTEASKNIAELGDIFKSPANETLTEEEQKNLQLGLLKLVVVIKEFGKGEIRNGEQTSGTNV
jgi:hypothetical protein